MTEESIVTVGNHGTSYVGPDAVAFFRAATIASALALYGKTGIIPTRGATATRLLALATGITGKTYGRPGKAAALVAAADVRTWCEAMKAALPVVDERKAEG